MARSAWRRYLRRTFSSLSLRDFRLYAFGQLISVSGTWMQKLAQAWLVLVLTDSGLLLGITAGLQQLPTLLFTNLGGAMADRHDKRTLLLVTQALSALPALALGTLVLLHAVQIWMVMVAALIQGFVDALDKPTRLTFVNDLAPKSSLANAVTINAIIQDSGKILGPAVAGVLIGTVGIAAGFFINALTFVPVIVALWMIRPRSVSLVRAPFRARGQLRETLVYVAAHPELATVLTVMAVAGLLAYNWGVMLPMLARDVFHGDASTVGFAFTAMGLGAVVGGLSVASLIKPTLRRVTLTALIFALVMALVGLAPSLWVMFCLLFLLGMASVTFRSTVNSLVQLNVDPRMRGRVISLLVIATAGTTPFGGPIMGWISENMNARVGCLVGAFGTAAAAAIAWQYLKVRGRGAIAGTDASHTEPAGASDPQTAPTAFLAPSGPLTAVPAGRKLGSLERYARSLRQNNNAR